MTTQELNKTINTRINELIKAGAKKEMMQMGYSDQDIKKELYQAAICSLLGV